MNLFEIFKNVGIIFSTVLGAIALMTMIIKPIRNKFLNIITKTSKVNETDKIIRELKSTFEDSFSDIRTDIKELKEESKLNQEANKCVLANRITHAYEKYHGEECIDLLEKDSLQEHYLLYKELGGNGKIEFRYRELMDKRVK